MNLNKKRNLKYFLIFYVLFTMVYYFVITNLWVFIKLRVSAPMEISYQFNFWKYLIGLTSIWMALRYITYSKIKDFIYTILSLILIFFIMPSSLIFSSFNDVDIKIFMFHNLFFWSTVYFSKQNINIPIKHFGKKTSYVLLVLLTFLAVIPFFFYAHKINLKNLFFIDVYKTRAIFHAINESNKYTAYTYSWLGRFIIPCTMVFSLYYKNIKILVISFFILIYLFLFGAHKSVLIGTGLIILLYRFNYIDTIGYLLKMLIILIVVSLSIHYIFDNNFLIVNVIRRGLIVPSFLDVPYFDFFKDKPLYWSQSFMGNFIQYPFEHSPPHMIGSVYFRTPKMAANNGLISDGYMNAGVIGVLINIFLVSVVFSILNQLKISNKFFGVIIWFFVVLMSSSLPTVILTHGGFVFVFLAIFFLRNTEETMD